MLGLLTVWEYKGNTYMIMGKVKSKNSVTGNWEEHYLYRNALGDRFTRECKDFESKFVA